MMIQLGNGEGSDDSYKSVVNEWPKDIWNKSQKERNQEAMKASREPKKLSEQLIEQLTKEAERQARLLKRKSSQRMPN
jgi:hypothetical protein